MLRRFSSFTTKLSFLKPSSPIPSYQVLDIAGRIRDASQDPKLPKETLRKMYKDMLTLNAMDIVMYDIQRQGRISFYMTNYGEEATHIGSAAALTNDDIIYGQYREAGVLLYRGFTIDEFMNQCFSNYKDTGKGRQMPVHYGSAKLNFQTISSPLATQIPHAAGAGFALKREGKPNCVMCYFGEGAASEGDFHAALNMAATTKSQVVFFCRNNGFAISTPSTEQYKGDGIAARGVGYGIKTIRVDGNDVFAVYNATKEAKRIAVEEQEPVLIEAMTYSTSDDSTVYRTREEVEKKRGDDPIRRFQLYMKDKKLWTEEEEVAFKEEIRKEIREALSRAEKLKKPSLRHMFTDVYDEMTPELKRQEQEMKHIVEKYKEHYPTDNYEK